MNSQSIHFSKNIFINEDYWVGLLEFSGHKKIALKALQQLVLMPTTYLSEKGFSCLVELTTKN